MIHARRLFLCLSALTIARPAAAGDCAADPILLDTNATLVCQGQSCSAVNTYNPGPTGCVSAFGSSIATPGRDVIYAIVLPPATSLDVVVLPESNWDPAVYALRSSDPDSILEPGVCVDGVDAAFTGSEEILRGIQNPSAAPDTLYIVVDSASTSAKFGCGPYTIEFRVNATISVGDNCASAFPLTLTAASGLVTHGGTTCNNSDAFVIDCPTFPKGTIFSGRDAVFAVTVEPAGPWSVSVTPLSDWDAALIVTTACGQPTGCAVADWWQAGQGEALLGLTNDVPNTTVYVVVDSSRDVGDPEGCGPFELHVRTGGLVPTTESSWGQVKARYR